MGSESISKCIWISTNRDYLWDNTQLYLWFTKESIVIKHNFRHVDALQYAKEGTLEQKLSEIYGG